MIKSSLTLLHHREQLRSYYDTGFNSDVVTVTTRRRSQGEKVVGLTTSKTVWKVTTRHSSAIHVRPPTIIHSYPDWLDAYSATVLS